MGINGFIIMGIVDCGKSPENPCGFVARKGQAIRRRTVKAQVVIS
jgi:hypothetical protein